jgi:hypothetical protein
MLSLENTSKLKTKKKKRKRDQKRLHLTVGIKREEEMNNSLGTRTCSPRLNSKHIRAKATNPAPRRLNPSVSDPPPSPRPHFVLPRRRWRPERRRDSSIGTARPVRGPSPSRRACAADHGGSSGRYLSLHLPEKASPPPSPSGVTEARAYDLGVETERDSIHGKRGCR